MERIMNITTYKNNNFTPYHHPELGEMLSHTDVALGYETSPNALTRTKSRNQDELIEGVHWLRVEVQTKGGKQRVIHWTLDGIHMLGFFIKSAEAKHFRKWASKLITEMRKGYTAKPTFHHQIAGYKSQIAQHNKKLERYRDIVNDQHFVIQKLEARIKQLQDPDCIASTVVRALQNQDKLQQENQELKEKMKQQLKLIVSTVERDIVNRFDESLEVTARAVKLSYRESTSSQK